MEQTFEEWKKERDDEIAKRKKDEEGASKKVQASKPTNIPRAPTVKQDDDDEYDEEDEKIIRESTKKGYCYFRRNLPEEEKQLIGDITPKPKAVSDPLPIANSNSVNEGSAWNKAGTWEERGTIFHSEEHG